MPRSLARRPAVWLLTPLLLLEACASAVPHAPQPPVTALDPPGLDAVRRALEGQPATLVIAGGEVVRDAEEVVLDADTTSWRDGEGRRSVPTAKVCKVVRQVRFRAGKGYAWGLLACAPVAWGVAQGEKDPLAGLGRLLLVEGICPLLGIFVASVLKNPPDRTVYAAAGSACEPAR